jgi:chromosome segregation ATPase
LDSVKTVLDDSAKYTFSADDQKIIDKIKSSLTNISEKIKTVIADINSYNINSSLTELKANIDNLTSSAAGTKDQITAKIGEITSKISAVNLRSGNLNYAVSALQKNIELSNNYNDIKIFFDSLYPGGVPAPVNL